MAGAILKALMLWVRKEKRQKSSRLAVTIRKDKAVQNLVSRMICWGKGRALRGCRDPLSYSHSSLIPPLPQGRSSPSHEAAGDRVREPRAESSCGP